MRLFRTEEPVVKSCHLHMLEPGVEKKVPPLHTEDNVALRILNSLPYGFRKLRSHSLVRIEIKDPRMLEGDILSAQF